MKNKVIDVSDLSPKQIAVIEEIIANFKSVSQQNNLSQDIKKPENQENFLNLAERIKKRLSSLENVEIPQITRDKMRNPPQFDYRLFCSLFCLFILRDRAYCDDEDKNMIAVS